jgi:hypothetical protein
MSLYRGDNFEFISLLVCEFTGTLSRNGFIVQEFKMCARCVSTRLETPIRPHQAKRGRPHTRKEIVAS